MYFFLFIFLISCLHQETDENDKGLGVEVENVDVFEEVVLKIDNPYDVEIILMHNYVGYLGETDGDVVKFNIPDIEGEYTFSFMQSGYIIEEKMVDFDNLDKIYRVKEVDVEETEIVSQLVENIRARKSEKYQTSKRKSSIYKTNIVNPCNVDTYNDSYRKREVAEEKFVINSAPKYEPNSETYFYESLLCTALLGAESESALERYYDTKGKETKGEKKFRKAFGKFCDATSEGISNSFKKKDKDKKDDKDG